MFTNGTSQQPSFYDIERQARRERDRILAACVRSLGREFAQWLVATAARLARLCAAELSRRRAARALHALDDHALADLGVARSGIESAVRGQWRTEDPWSTQNSIRRARLQRQAA